MKFCAYLMTSESVFGHCWLASLLFVLCIIVLLQLVNLPKQWMLQSAARPLYFYKFLVMCYIFLVYVAIVPLLIHYIKFIKFSSFLLRFLCDSVDTMLSRRMLNLQFLLFFLHFQRHYLKPENQWKLGVIV